MRDKRRSFLRHLKTMWDTHGTLYTDGDLNSMEDDVTIAMALSFGPIRPAFATVPGVDPFWTDTWSNQEHEDRLEPRHELWDTQEED